MKRRKTVSMGFFFKELWKNSLLDHFRFGMGFIVLYTSYRYGMKDPLISEVINFVPEIHHGSQCKNIFALFPRLVCWDGIPTGVSHP